MSNKPVTISVKRRALLWAATATVLLASCAVQPPVMRSAEVRVMTSGAFTAPYKERVPMCEKETGHKVLSAYGALMGNAPDAIPVRLERGEAADIVIMAGRFSR